MIEFRLEDIFRAFIRNYGSMELAEIYYATHWTNRILRYFEELGQLMGFYAYYEWQKYDLTWFEEYNTPTTNKAPILHVEHENDYDRLLHELLDKVRQSPARNIVTICYPRPEEDIAKFDAAVQQHIDSLKREVSVLAIHDGYHYSPKREVIKGHILRTHKKMTECIAKRMKMMNRNEGDGTYYARMDELCKEI